ncbi:HBL375Wp [Eremothecium sinecaudum]|uniref:HBL375Wp n=1 Tax=Eremothecium sinecaudum TaxID=45286 RepID=A0A120K0P1_9SACH|nr:HBL375Wp [Eremothecium sinecaudum]AMD18527.1 HBL375Wp [Eremothecium sinecaudum]
MVQASTHSDGLEWIGIHSQDRGQTEHFESLVDKHRPWIPIHRLRKNRSLCWTHYLCQDASLKVLKCKHCGGLLVHIGKDRSSTSRFRSHLKHHHRIDPNSDYYMGTSLLPMSATGAKRIAEKPQRANKVSLNNSNNYIGVNGIQPMTSQTNQLAFENQTPASGDVVLHKAQKPPKARRTVLRTDLLLGIMTASQDLRHDFFENDVVKELLGRLSDFDSLDLPAAITHTAQDIDDIITRTVVLNKQHLSGNLLVKRGQSINSLKLVLTERIHALSQLSFFSISYRHWHKPKISTWFLNFYDPLDARQYSFLVDACMNKPPLRAGIEIARPVVSRYAGIERYVVSNMAPNSHLNIKDGEEWNICAASELYRCFLKLFGESNSTFDVSDTLMSLEHITVTNPLISQIKDFSRNSRNEWQASISQLDPVNYSTLTESITSLLKLRPLLDMLDPPPFSSNNYLEMVHFTDVAQGFNRVLQFFTRAPQQIWQFTLLAVIALDEQLSQTLEEVVPGSKFGNHVENCVSATSRFKRRLLGQEHYVLASFLVPTTLFDDGLLKTLFETDSLNTVVDIVVNMIYVLLADYLDVKISDEAEATYNENSIGVIRTQEEFANIAKDVIRDDIYAYLQLVDEVVPAAFQARCSKLGITKSSNSAGDGQYATYMRNDTFLAPLDTFLEIHVPVARRFYLEKWNTLGPVMRFVLKMLNSQPASTITSTTSFLASYKPICDDDMVGNVLKVKCLESQFYSTKIDFDHDSLPLICKFASKISGC